MKTVQINIVVSKTMLKFLKKLADGPVRTKEITAPHGYALFLGGNGGGRQASLYDFDKQAMTYSITKLGRQVLRNDTAATELTMEEGAKE